MPSITKKDYDVVIPQSLFLDPALSLEAKGLAGVMDTYADWDDGQCWPAQKLLSLKTGKSENTIRKYMDELEQRGYLERQRRGQGLPNLYICNWRAPQKTDNQDAQILSIKKRKISDTQNLRTNEEPKEEETITKELSAEASSAGVFFNTTEFLTLFDTLKKEHYPDYQPISKRSKEASLIAPYLRAYPTALVLKALHRFFSDNDGFLIKNGHRVEEFVSRFPHFIDDAYWDDKDEAADHQASMDRAHQAEKKHEAVKRDWIEEERKRIEFGKPIGLQVRLAALTADVGRPIPREPGEEE